MSRFAVIMVLRLAAVAWLSESAGAIDVKPSMDTARATTQAPASQPREAKALPESSPKSERVLLDRLKRQVRQKDSSAAPQYDNYIDADGNGVDDRLGKAAKVKEQPRDERPARAAPEHRVKAKRSVKRPPPKEKP